MSKTSLSLLKQMLFIRILEERIAEIYSDGEMRTPTHFSTGQEAVSVGVCAALNKNDAVFAPHRCHAAYLAKGGDLNGMVAELFGKATGVCGGKSGSAHLSSPEKNMYSAPILGALIPVAVGAAFSFTLDKKKNVSIAFLGDAASEEGVFMESLNFAIIKKLPVLFVCENNFFSTNIHIKNRQPDIPIYKRLKGFGIETCKIDGNDVDKVYKTASSLIDKLKQGKGPVFMECTTYRFLEHVGPNFDFENPYRTEAEVKSWMKRCPIKRLQKRLVNNGTVTEKQMKRFADSCHRKVDDALEFARQSPWPVKEDLLNNVY